MCIITFCIQAWWVKAIVHYKLKCSCYLLTLMSFVWLSFFPRTQRYFEQCFCYCLRGPKQHWTPLTFFYIDKFLFCFPKKVRFGTTGGLLVDSSFKSLTYLKLLAERCCWGKISGLSSELWGLSPLGGPMTFFIPPGSRSRSSSGCLWIVVVFF